MTQDGPKSCSEMVADGRAPSDECLRRAAPHVAHDIKMLAESWRRRTDPLGWIVWFACCRSLMGFFGGDCRQKPDNKGTYKDDICARDFLTDEAWLQALKEAESLKPAGYDDYRGAVNKLAAHLTFSRIEYAEKAQSREGFEPSKQVTDYLLGLSTLFVRKLPPDRAAWFGGLMF